jgi:DoxX-like family
MFTAYVIVTIVTIAANAFSGVAAILHFKPILPGMARAGVPESWLTFPIGTLKTAGAAGLLLGLIGVPLIGAAAAIGLILFSCVPSTPTSVQATIRRSSAWRTGTSC